MQLVSLNQRLRLSLSGCFFKINQLSYPFELNVICFDDIGMLQGPVHPLCINPWITQIDIEKMLAADCTHHVAQGAMRTGTLRQRSEINQFRVHGERCYTG